MKHFLYYSVLLCLCACNQITEPSDAEYVISIRPDDISKKVTYSSLIEDYYIVPLDTSTQALIANIDKLIIEDEKYFISDARGQGKILVFDKTGKFLYSIGSKGQSNAEYTMLGNFTIDKENKQIIILDIGGQKLLYYTLTGEFIKAVPLQSFSARKITAYNKLLVFDGWGRHDRLIITDLNARVIGSYLPYNVKNSGGLINPYAHSGDTLLFKVHMCDTVFALYDNNVFPSRIIDFGEKAFTWNQFQRMNEYEKWNLPKYFDRYYTHIKYYVENKDMILFMFFAENNPTQVFYDKISRQKIVCPFNIDNDITFENNIPIMEYTYNDYFVGTIQPYSILNSMPKQMKESWSDVKKQNYLKIRQLCTSLTEDSNILLFFVHLKNIPN